MCNLDKIVIKIQRPHCNLFHWGVRLMASIYTQFLSRSFWAATHHIDIGNSQVWNYVQRHTCKMYTHTKLRLFVCKSFTAAWAPTAILTKRWHKWMVQGLYSRSFTGWGALSRYQHSFKYGTLTFDVFLRRWFRYFPCRGALIYTAKMRPRLHRGGWWLNDILRVNILVRSG